MRFPDILRSCGMRDGASEMELQSAEQRLGQRLPEDYRAVLLESDGFEGFVRRDVYLVLWSVSELVSLNDAYAVSEFIPGVTLLGTDGGDTGYGFRRKGERVEYVAVPLVGMEPGAVVVIGESVEDLLERLTR